MVTCTGKSLIPVSITAYQQFMNFVVPEANVPKFDIKLDARSNMKSSFVKLEGTDLAIHTGALVNVGLSKFTEVPDVESLLLLFTLYGVKKIGQDFEIKSSDEGVAALKADPLFQGLVQNLHLFMAKFRPLNEQALSTVSMLDDAGSVGAESVSKETKKSGPGVSPFKDVPLRDTPKIEVPADLDLRLV